MKAILLALTLFACSATLAQAECPDPLTITAAAAETPPAGPTDLANIPDWFWTYVPDVVWIDWREILA